MSTQTTVPLFRLKYAATINDDALGENTDPDYEIQYIDISNVDSLGKIHELGVYRFADAPSRARRLVRQGDVIISCVRTYLQAIAPIQEPPENLVVSTGFAVIRPRLEVFDTNFSKYALRNPAFLSEVEKRSVGVSYPAINASDLGDISIHLPPLPQQRAISDFLDRETAQIDALIAAKERLLEILAEKRRAIILHVVTQGLDPNIPLRDSGVPWIGKIPVHWDALPVKFGFAWIGSGTTPPSGNSSYYGGDVPWVTSSELRENVIEGTSQKITISALNEFSSLKIYPKCSLLFAMYGATIGRVALLAVEATVNQAVCVMASATRWEPEFAFIAFQASRDYLIAEASGGGQPNLNAEKVRNQKLSCPPLIEQRTIVEHSKREMAKLDAIRDATEKTIALLKERRAALVAATVSGQIPIEGAV